MKKWLIILIIFFLSSCKPTEKMTIMAPQGSPAMTIVGLNDDDYAIDIVNGADPLIAAFGSKSHDVIIAPTNLGAKLFQSKEDYQLAAVLIWGNYHLVSTQFTHSSLSEIQGKEIIVFGQNQTSDIIIKHVLNQENIQATITYVDSVQTASSQYIHDPSKIVMVAEPSLSKIKSLVPDTKSIDLQEEYEKLHQGLSYPQASLFVKKDATKQEINHLLLDFEKSIAFMNNKSTDALTKGVSLGIVDHTNLLLDSVDGSHLMLKKPNEVMDSITAYLSIILEMNPNLIGGSLPNDSFYWSDSI